MRKGQKEEAMKPEHKKEIFKATILAIYALVMSILIAIMVREGKYGAAIITSLFVLYIFAATGVMRKIIGWALSWSLYWIGHWISFSLLAKRVHAPNPSRLMKRGVDFYSKIMAASAQTQDWGGVSAEFGPWGPAVNGEE